MIIETSTLVREWYAQIAEASKTPGLAQHLVRRTGELFPRFASFYDKLRALPRRLRRAIARRRGFSLASVAMLLALCGGTMHAATIPVDGITCRLADAITASNDDRATNGCPPGSGADVIVLNADVTLSASLPSIRRGVTIQAGSHSIVDGAGRGCFDVEFDFAPTVFDGLTIRNCSRNSGAAVYNSSSLTISNCTISNNTATYGGAIVNEGGAGRLTIEGSTISGNTATGSGGGIFHYGETLDVVQSVISGNTAGSDGGGIYLGAYTNPTLHVTDSVVSGNAAGFHGGGIANTGHNIDGGGSVITIFGSTISGNTATYGGGFESYTHTSGGDNSVRIEQTTISGNTATLLGGGLYQTIDFGGCYASSYVDSLALVNVTITNNEAGVLGGGVYLGCPLVSISHSLVSGNTAPTSPEMSLERSTGVTVDGFNVVGYDGDARSSGFTPGPADIVPASGVQVSDILAPLANNGGFTQTHALVAGSPALDAIPTSDSNCAGTFDQRGVPRPAGPGCDTGSFELEEAHVAFGGSVTGFTPKKVVCADPTTGQREVSKSSGSPWDCEALGLDVSAGDKVQTSASGVAEPSAVGGSVTRMTPSSVTCENVTTGQRVKARTSATTWDCQALGLVVMPGDTVTTGASGTAD